MVATIKPCTLVGIDAELVDVECTIDRGLPQYEVVAFCDVDPTADLVPQVM